jgi:hypothetical protein
VISTTYWTSNVLSPPQVKILDSELKHRKRIFNLRAGLIPGWQMLLLDSVIKTMERDVRLV